MPKCNTRLPPITVRVEALDGFRALAVGLVVLYHYFSFWIYAGNGFGLLAYDGAFAKLLVSFGFIGVHLFFVVSGFVILLTLERSKNLREFWTNRAIRLWPPLILFGTLTFVVVNAWGPPSLRVGVWEYLLSIFALPPHHVGELVGADNWKWLDSVYWTLWVEVRFYLLIGLIYFWRPNPALYIWLGFEVTTMVLGLFAAYDIGGRPISLIQGLLFQPYVPYFSFGMAAYLAYTGHNGPRAHLLALLAVCHLALLWLLRIDSEHYQTHGLIQYLYGDTAILVLFYFFAWRKRMTRIFSFRPITRMGRASYGLYLLHQNVGLTVLALPVFAGMASGLTAFLTASAAIFIAIVSFEKLERPLQSWLRKRLSPRQAIAV